MEARRVLFVCTHNSARSQMAEGMVRAWGRERFDPHSAGTEPRPVRPEAVEVMNEIGVDIAAQLSKHLDHYLDQPFHWVITVCDDLRNRIHMFLLAAGRADLPAPAPRSLERKV